MPEEMARRIALVILFGRDDWDKVKMDDPEIGWEIYISFDELWRTIQLGSTIKPSGEARGNA